MAADASLAAARAALGAGALDDARTIALEALAVDGAADAGWLELLLAEVEAAAGRHEASARWSVRAERSFAGADDAAGTRAVGVARALRALLRGDGVAGMRLAEALVPELDAAGDALAAAWLRLGWAQRLLDDDRAAEALVLATDVIEVAPAPGERLVAAAVAARALAAMNRPVDAAQVAASALDRDREADSPMAIRAMAYRELGIALAAAGHDELCHLCLDLAAGLADPTGAPAAALLGLILGDAP